MSRTARTIVHGLRIRQAQDWGKTTQTQGTDLHVMRESNRLLVLNCVREQGAIPRAEVARFTGLSRTTVGNIVDDLLSEGFIREGDSQRAEPSGGRRIIPLHFNASAGYIIGIAMGRNHLTLLLSDLAAVIIHQHDVPFLANEGAEIGLLRLVAAVKAFVSEQHIPWGKLIGIGIGMPGPIDVAQRGPVAPPHMPGWDGVNVQQMLAAALELPIYLDNNANMGALGECRFGAGRDVANLLYVKIGTGIGGGLVIGGQIYRGSSGSAGEIGHMTVDPQGLLCNCGNRGCLETIAGKGAILARAQAAAPEMLTIAAVIQAAQAGHPAGLQALYQAGEAVGTIIAGLVNFFNPALIILDGSTMRAGDLLLEPIQRTVRARGMPAPLAGIRIIAGSLQGNAIALGGVAMVIDAAFATNPTLQLAFQPATMVT